MVPESVSSQHESLLDTTKCRVLGRAMDILNLCSNARLQGCIHTEQFHLPAFCHHPERQKSADRTEAPEILACRFWRQCPNLKSWWAGLLEVWHEIAECRYYFNGSVPMLKLVKYPRFVRDTPLNTAEVEENIGHPMLLLL